MTHELTDLEHRILAEGDRFDKVTPPKPSDQRPIGSHLQSSGRIDDVEAARLIASEGRRLARKARWTASGCVTRRD